jgi:hypothetical protein
VRGEQLNISAASRTPTASLVISSILGAHLCVLSRWDDNYQTRSAAEKGNKEDVNYFRAVANSWVAFFPFVRSLLHFFDCPDSFAKTVFCRVG